MSAEASTRVRPAILVADDDPLIVATLSQELRTAGFDVLEACDSVSALEICVQHNPALAVIDYAMPGATGVELARMIAERSPVPVMFLSAYSDDSIVQSAIHAGAMAYLVKPVDTGQLLPAIRTALQRARELGALRFQADQLNTALQAGRNVSVAIGLLMAKFQVGQQEALDRLRRYARANRMRLEDVATQVLRATDEASRVYDQLGQHASAGAAPPRSRSEQ